MQRIHSRADEVCVSLSLQTRKESFVRKRASLIQRPTHHETPVVVTIRQKQCAADEESRARRLRGTFNNIKWKRAHVRNMHPLPSRQFFSGVEDSERGIQTGRVRNQSGGRQKLLLHLTAIAALGKMLRGAVSSRAASAQLSARLSSVRRGSRTVSVPRCCLRCRMVIVGIAIHKAGRSWAF